MSALPLKIGHAFVFGTKITGKVSVRASNISAETAGGKSRGSRERLEHQQQEVEAENDCSMSSRKWRQRDKIEAGLLMTRISSSHSHTTSVELEDAANASLPPPPPPPVFNYTSWGYCGELCACIWKHSEGDVLLTHSNLMLLYAFSQL